MKVGCLWLQIYDDLRFFYSTNHFIGKPEDRDKIEKLSHSTHISAIENTNLQTRNIGAICNIPALSQPNRMDIPICQLGATRDSGHLGTIYNTWRSLEFSHRRVNWGDMLLLEFPDIRICARNPRVGTKSKLGTKKWNRIMKITNDGCRFITSFYQQWFY